VLVGFVVAVVVQGRYASGNIEHGRAGLRPLFPSPADARPAPAASGTSDPS
jgi:hypothetical protein